MTDLAKRIAAQLPPLPRVDWRGVVPDPEAGGPDSDRDAIAAALPEGWELREAQRVPDRRRQGWEYRVHAVYVLPVTPPWTAARVLDLYEQNGRAWSTVAKTLGVGQRTLERWILEHDDFVALRALIRTEQRRRGGRRHRGRS